MDIAYNERVCKICSNAEATIWRFRAFNVLSWHHSWIEIKYVAIMQGFQV